MAASTITVKLSPSEYRTLKNSLVELRELMSAHLRMREPIQVEPLDPKERVQESERKHKLAELIDSI